MSLRHLQTRFLRASSQRSSAAGAHLASGRPSPFIPFAMSSTAYTTSQPPEYSSSDPSTNSTTPDTSEASTKTSLAIEPPSSAASSTTKLDVSQPGGSTVKLDSLGPLVVNANGTVARVGNWAQMTQAEKDTTVKVLGRRNKARLEKLRAEGKDISIE